MKQRTELNNEPVYGGVQFFFVHYVKKAKNVKRKTLLEMIDWNKDLNPFSKSRKVSIFFF